MTVFALPRCWYRFIAVCVVVSMLSATSCCGRVSIPRRNQLVSTVYGGLAYPVAVEFDAAGDIIFTSYYGCMIGRIDKANGLPVWVAGAFKDCRFADGVGAAARFNIPLGLAVYKTLNVAFVAEQWSHLIRVVHLRNASVTTAAGSVAGFVNGVGAAARFNQPVYVMLYPVLPNGGLLYIAEYGNGAVRRYNITSGEVTTVAIGMPALAGLCGLRSGRFLFGSGDSNQIVRIEVSSGAVTVLAGSGVAGFADGVGTAAKFYHSRGVALNTDETALIVPDWYNLRVRRVNLVTLRVDTVAGTGAQGAADGPPLSATFVSLTDGKWTCGYERQSCGVLVADYSAVGSIRYVPVEGVTQTSTATPMLSSTASSSGEGSSTATYTPRRSTSETISTSMSISCSVSTSDRSASGDSTATITASTTATVRNTLTTTMRPTWSSSAPFATPSITATASPSGEESSTPTSTMMPTQTVQRSTSETISTSMSTSCSVSTSDLSASGDSTATLTASTTATVRKTLTLTLLGTTTIKPTCSSSAPFVTPSITATASPSSEGSSTLTKTMTLTVTQSARRSKSVTFATSMSASCSVSTSDLSASGEATVTLTAPTSATVRGTLTLTVLDTPTGRLTSSSSAPCATPSITATASSTSEGSSTPTRSMTAMSLRRTMSVSAGTQTRSRTQWECSTVASRAVAAGLQSGNASALPQIVTLRPSNMSVPPLLVTAAGIAQPPTVSSLDALPVVAITAAAPTRLRLLEDPAIVLNMTLLAVTQLLYYYARSVHTAKVSAFVGLRYLSTRARDGVWHAVAVAPPPEGWLPSTPVLLYGELMLTVTFGCGDSGAVLAVEVVVPSPGVPRELADRVRQGAQIALIASLLATGAVSGSALGRLVATDSIALCDADAAGSGGVVDLGVVLCAASPRLVDARSTVVSNAVLIAAVAAVLLALSALWWRVRCVPFVEALGVFSLPSSVLPVATAAMPSTATATTLLIAGAGESSCAAGDVLLVVLGVVQVVAPVALLVVLHDSISSDESVYECAARPHHPVGGSNSVVGRVLRQLRTTTSRRWEWRRVDGAPLAAMRCAWAVLLEHRVVWYATVDCVFLVLVSSLPVWGGLDASNEALCRWCGAAVVALLAVQLGVLAYTRPYTTHFSLAYNVLTTALTCVSAAFQLAFVVLSLTSTTGLWLLDASVVCNLLVLGVTIVKTLLDVGSIAAAVKRRLGTVCGWGLLAVEATAVVKNAARLVVDALDKEVDVLEFGWPVKAVRAVNAGGEDACVPVDLDDRVFWDMAGRAIGTEEVGDLNAIMSIEGRL